MSRPARAGTLVALAALVAAAGCGGAGTTAPATTAAPGTLEGLWRTHGEAVGLVAGTQDHAPGRNRVSFLVVRGNGAVVKAPRARVWIARARDARPFATAQARLVQTGVPGRDAGFSNRLYVAHLQLPSPGTYWLLAEPLGARPAIRAIGTVKARARTQTPALGAPAPASRTPTLALAHGRPSRITTASPPDVGLLRWSVAESLAAHVPFVVVFATPRFCTSRTCGPVVDVVDAVRRRFAGRRARFIHVEIYEDNDPAKGENRWVREWNLPTEPWTFVVDGGGRIRAKFEGGLSVAELEAAVRRVLRPAKP